MGDYMPRTSVRAHKRKGTMGVRSHSRVIPSKKRVEKYLKEHREVQLKISALEDKMLSDRPKRSMSAYSIRQKKRKERIDILKVKRRKIEDEFERGE